MIWRETILYNNREGNVVVWFTGLSGSGKTTISDILSEKLKSFNKNHEILDGDVVRKELSPDLGFSKEDREKHNYRIIYLAKLLSKNRIITIVPVIAPFKNIREYAREHIENFVEIYVNTPIEECIKRDPKGLYEKALKGEIKEFTGLSSPYEEPDQPDLIMDTMNYTPEQCADHVIEYLEKNNFIQLEINYNDLRRVYGK